MSDTRKVAEQIAKAARKLFDCAHGSNGWPHAERSVANMIVGAVETALTAELAEAKRHIKRLHKQIEFSLKHWPDDRYEVVMKALFAASPAPPQEVDGDGWPSAREYNDAASGKTRTELTAHQVGEIVAWFRLDSKDDRSPCWRFLIEQDSAKGIADAIEAGDYRPAKETE